MIKDLFKYFIDTSENLITVAVISGLILGYAKTAFSKIGRIIAGSGVFLGIVTAGIMAYVKNTTNIVDPNKWNLRVFTLSIGFLGLLVLASAGAKILGNISAKNKKLRLPAEIVSDIAAFSACALITGYLFYNLPDIYKYPYSIYLVEKTVMSTAFILKTIGILLGLIFAFVAGLAANRVNSRHSRGTAFIFMLIGTLIYALRHWTGAMRILLTKRIIPMDKKVFGMKVFEIVKFTANNERLFIYSAMAVLIIAAIALWIKSFISKEPYSNPAEHRKIRRKWIVSRRWGTAAAACMLLSTGNMTFIDSWVNKVIELSPVEDAVIEGDDIVVTFEQVADGHLHRFGYMYDNVQIRFIVIKKPNSSSYGIGLDACDICGETGYYEKDGQVVCKLCDVVMNVNTIGFKGGCNPIVIPYEVHDGKIFVPIEGLLEHKDEFHNRKI